MGKLIIVAISLCIAYIGVMPAHAEVIKLSVGSQASNKQAISRPLNGVSRQQVSSQFGEPISIQGPVGEPPISSWEYADYYVFFEYDRVLHTVFKHVPVPGFNPDPEQAPAGPTE